MFHLSWDVITSPWLAHPEERWNVGLTRAGIAWRNSLQRSYYGESPTGGPMTYQRTGTLANKSNFRITREGKEMELISVHYLPYLLFGTGVYGPRSSPITPKSAPMLVWKASANFGFKIGAKGGVMKSGRGMTFAAKSVRGTIWPGKKDELVERMRHDFEDGVVNWLSW